MSPSSTATAPADAAARVARPSSFPSVSPSDRGRYWLNLPCTDPLGRVFAEDGRIFRAIYPEKVDAARAMLASPAIVDLMRDGLIAHTAIDDRQVEGAGLVVEVERAAFDVPCDRFLRSCLRVSLERWIEITLRLEGSGWYLSDAHFGNFMLYGRNEPRWIDLGSIRSTSGVQPPGADEPFQCFRDLWVAMMAPLLLQQRDSKWERLCRLAIADGPAQGPKTTTAEPMLRLDGFVTAELTEFRNHVGAATGREALVKTFEFACAHLLRSPPSALPAAPSPIAPDRLAGLLATPHAKSITCLGGDVFAAFASDLAARHVLVIDEDEARLERAAAALAARDGGSVALCVQHVVNRIFLRAPPQADAVLAVDPFNRFQHISAVALDNIAEILARMTGKLAIIVVPQDSAATIVPVLRRVFDDVAAEPAAATHQTVLVSRRLKPAG